MEFFYDGMRCQDQDNSRIQCRSGWILSVLSARFLGYSCCVMKRIKALHLLPILQNTQLAICTVGRTVDTLRAGCR